MIALTVVLAVFVGIALGLLGGGGSILTVPLLAYVAGMDAKQAIATSLLVVGTTSVVAAVSHARAGRVQWRTGLVFGVAGMVGAYAGQKALEQVPFVGGFIGQKAGAAIGCKIAIEASGGWDFIKSTSDMSFNSIDDMVVWLYATKSTNEHYQDVVKAVGNIYPEFKDRQWAALNAARRP